MQESAKGIQEQGGRERVCIFQTLMFRTNEDLAEAKARPALISDPIDDCIAEASTFVPGEKMKPSSVLFREAFLGPEKSVS